ncbi:MAG: glycoside hydrolase family 55 protein [Gemmataceae bacterium]|nr:glycoside hydrolase family 55 protein [Gemmataceae bacterium]
MQSGTCYDRLAFACLLGLSVWLGDSTSSHATEVPRARIDEQADRRFPASNFVVDVTQPPYNAKGDGKTDDTAAIQKAINDVMGLHKVIYLPNGTYLISDTLNWKNKNSKGAAAYGFNWVQGQNTAKTVIRLKDDTFADASKPKAMMWCGGFGSADWFHNFVQGVTFDVGKGNAGAIGLQFYSNNTGAVRDCVIVSQDGHGDIGLDLGHRDMNGPLLVQRVSVKGFRRGVVTARAVNSQTFEHLTLTGQTEFGFDNHGQAISVRGLVSDNAVPAVRSYGTLALLDATLTGRAEANKLPAIVNYNGGRMCLRDITTTGYGRALADVATPDYFAALRVAGADKEGSEGPKIAEYFSHPATSPFGGPPKSLRLPVEETPDVPWDDPKTWAVVDAFGADPTGQKDSSAAIQKAIDSGATTIFFSGFYAVEKSVTVRGKARRLLGTGAWIDYTAKSKPDFIIADGDAKVVVVEYFAPIGGGIEIRTDRTVVVRSVQCPVIKHQGKGPLFLEDVTTDDLRIKKDQQVWARQLNVENEGPHVTNDGGKFWVLGYKTERGGTLLHTRGGGQSEVFGTFSYTTTAGKLAPMFVNEDASVFAFFSEVCYTGDPFALLIRETRKGATKEVKRGDGTVTPYVGIPTAK